MDIKTIQSELTEEFKALNDWEDKYGKIIKLGKELNDFPEELRIEKNKIDGCQSQVWMHAEFNDGRVNIKADSDAIIVKGLIALLIKVYSNQTPQEILNNPPEFLSNIGVDTHLSPTRKNGLSAMLKQIKLYAIAFSALNK